MIFSGFVLLTGCVGNQEEDPEKLILGKWYRYNEYGEYRNMWEFYKDGTVENRFYDQYSYKFIDNSTIQFTYIETGYKFNAQILNLTKDELILNEKGETYTYIRKFK